jgi:hypothetical protein
MRGLFSVGPHNFSAESEQPSNFCEAFGLATPCPSVLRAQRLDFLLFDSRTTEFGTVVHKGLHMESFRYWSGSCCCTRILRKANYCPNFAHLSIHMLWLVLSIWPFVCLDFHLGSTTIFPSTLDLPAILLVSLPLSLIRLPLQMQYHTPLWDWDTQSPVATLVAFFWQKWCCNTFSSLRHRLQHWPSLDGNWFWGRNP